ncbi:uncharacterized protein LOC106462825 isoform X1 [Limulus polyphemus]|uniref:Uncharacterized protein LOC106462825 isoform X1 n=2 Tax=Limulus polyphemus TaxID=6850 RepID=A0ABM1SQK5_LIMPO|nr:uncharacterized protein LOC106462825 isoform X1 [Limulus polyphemus]
MTVAMADNFTISREQFKEFLHWLIVIQDPRDLWRNHATFLCIEVVVIICFILTYKHATRHGGRFLSLWWTVVMSGLIIESISYLVPQIDNFWHSQATVMFLGHRLPLLIVCVYPVLLYTSAAAVSRLWLPFWAEPFAVGLTVLAIDVPWDINGVNFVWWTWHDTDPNIYDRHYWVPWSSFYFLAALGCTLTFLLHGFRWLLTGNDKYSSGGFFKEALASILTAILIMPVASIQFVPLYHLLKDELKIHSEVCVFLFLSMYLMIFWLGDRDPSIEARPKKGRCHHYDELIVLLGLWYITHFAVAIFGHPESVVATGLREPIGPCDQYLDVFTPMGQVLQKRKYLCLEDYDEGYYDFHCVPKHEMAKLRIGSNIYWYTVCGVQFSNYAEYVTVIGGYCVLGIFVFYQYLLRSGSHLSLSKMAKKVAIKSKTN